MIRNHNDIIVKIYYNGNNISKVFKNNIQVFPDKKFEDLFWIKVNDISDSKTYYYLCKKTNVVYDESDSNIIKEITYSATTRQENSPGENETIYELLNDDVEITGQTYNENDFESFDGKSPNEVLEMTQTYQEKLITDETVGLQPNDYVNDNLLSEYNISEIDQVLNYHQLKLSDFSGSIDDYEYIMDWNKGYSKITNKQLGFIKIENTDINDIKIQYIAWSGWNLAQVFISDSVDDIKTVINDNGAHDVYELTDLKHIIIGYGGYGTWECGYKPAVYFGDDTKTKKIYDLIIPAGKTYYFCCFWYTTINGTAQEGGYGFSQYMTCIFFNKNVNIVSLGNILTHKYISDEILEKQIKKIKYNYTYALIKNDLSNKIYQTNCKYILSKEELQTAQINNVLVIPVKSLGWKLLSNEDFLKYSPKNSNYKFVLTVANFVYTGDEFFGLLDKSLDYSNDFRIFGASSSDVYFDPGSNRIYFTRNSTNTTVITFIINGTTNMFEAWENNSQLCSWDYSQKTCGGFTDNNTGLYLNAFGSESDLTNESLYFYEFKIIDTTSDEVIKRFVPSDDPKRLYETVSMTYIEPCRTVDDASLPTLIDNLKLGVETVDGLGNKIEDWYI